MSDRLNANQFLRPNQFLTSQNGEFNLVLQRDGNLVVYNNRSGSPLWASNTYGRRVDYALMQADGNFVIYGSDREVWSTSTFRLGEYLVLEDDGNLVIYNRQNRPAWTTGTNVISPLSFAQPLQSSLESDFSDPSNTFELTKLNTITEDINSSLNSAQPLQTIPEPTSIISILGLVIIAIYLFKGKKHRSISCIK